MYAKHPELAKEFESATPKGKKLPQHVKPKAKAIKKSKQKSKQRPLDYLWCLYKIYYNDFRLIYF